MADILFTHSNHLYYDSKQVSKMQPYPPLQAIIAAAYLRKHGIDVALFDTTLNAPESGFPAALEYHRPKMVIICEDNFNFITKMCLKRNRDTAFLLGGIAHSFGLPVVINSPDSSIHPIEYLAQGIDYVVLGEPENTFLDLATFILGPFSRDISLIAGLSYVDADKGVRFTSRRAKEIELNRFPMPAWDLIDIEGYRDSWIYSHGFFSLNLVASRGCPYRCNWCAKPIFGQIYRSLSAKRTADEVKYVLHAFSPDQIWFADDVFALSNGWMNQFANEICEIGARLSFKIQSRCDLITHETASDLKRVGCSEVWLGAESGSQKILDAMGKDVHLDQIHEARKILKIHGIRAGFFLQFGYPSEDLQDIRKTIEMVRETTPDDIGISVSYPLPGTHFYDRVVVNINGESTWTESGDLSLVFRAPYGDEFYTALHEALHLEVDILNGRAGGVKDQQKLSKLWSKIDV